MSPTHRPHTPSFPSLIYSSIPNPTPFIKIQSFTLNLVFLHNRITPTSINHQSILTIVQSKIHCLKLFEVGEYLSGSTIAYI
ncbi:hypothetical protein L1987_64643 [Smallanthus sonchifolius]|uniref:Uncharacterized protein n=1 Tax=Smallanthus sonchifolius TaxID=185202 RepID=A0ACB9BS47_9ASTR|nr:hypothetical protein L1987_87639 [Smallanthus sonchifolius]KAI3724876.1 hypothetical protein L1987_64643 [Smallanthus sonchifolius]